MSVISTLNEQVAVLPEASVAVKLFTVVPTENAAPLANPALWLKLPPAQLSLELTL
ncbi:MAG: hypothetical protein U0176_11600 [Bacteroidia bacterium]